MNEKEEEKMLKIIINQLDVISKSMVNLNDRIDRLEGKTNDIHQYVPFVGWLEGVGKVMSKRLMWLRGVPELPRLTVSDDENSCTIVDI
jgi:hypothetical protein